MIEWAKRALALGYRVDYPELGLAVAYSKDTDEWRGYWSVEGNQLFADAEEARKFYQGE